MDNIKNNLKNIRHRIKKKEQQDKSLRFNLNNALQELFPEIKNPLQYVKDFYFKNQKIYIITINKPFANELQLNKETLLERLKTGEIIIK